MVLLYLRQIAGIALFEPSNESFPLSGHSLIKRLAFDAIDLIQGPTRVSLVALGSSSPHLYLTLWLVNLVTIDDEVIFLPAVPHVPRVLIMNAFRSDRWALDLRCIDGVAHLVDMHVRVCHLEVGVNKRPVLTLIELLSLLNVNPCLVHRRQFDCRHNEIIYII